MVVSRSYSFGWVCAIHPELVAAILQLDSRHDSTDFEQPEQDNNTYVFGSIGKHNIVVATLPQGEYGTTSAATVARDMVRSFPDLRLVLMVGVAGGTPLIDYSRPQAPIVTTDVRLGDVVVGMSSGSLGATIQHDFGKALPNGTFLQTSHLNYPPRWITTAVTALRADLEIYGNDLIKDRGTKLSDKPQIVKYQKPPDTKDQLYHSQCIHPANDERDCSLACTDHVFRVVTRPSRLIAGSNIHYGLIASGNSVIKDANIRDSLAQKGVLCVEMEAAGLMNHLPALVIRGICDYADSHKNKQWQEHAAMSAAVYARLLILRTSQQRVEAAQRLGATLSNSKILYDSLELRNIQKKSTEREWIIRKKIWLAAPDPFREHYAANSARHGDTGQWFKQKDYYTCWEQTPGMLLLLGGIGCGKTILSSAIINHLEASKTKEDILIYWFFTFSDTRKQKVADMCRSLIRQLDQQSDECQTIFTELYDRCEGSYRQPYKQELIEYSLKMLQCVKGRDVYLIVDALDECDDFTELMDYVTKLEQAGSDKLHFLATSRAAIDLSQELPKCMEKRWITKADVEDDIRSYLQFKMTSSQTFARWRSQQDVLQMVNRTLVSKADGMFQWATCQLDELGKCVSRSDLEKKLQSLPTDLNVLYSEIIARLPLEHRRRVVLALHFIAFSYEPLELTALNDFLAVKSDQPVAFDPLLRFADPTDLLRMCSNLVLPIEERRTGSADGKVYVRLAHASVKDFFLTQTFDTEFDTALPKTDPHALIARTCLAYLLDLPHDWWKAEPILDYEPLVDYASTYFLRHIADCSTIDSLTMDAALNFLTTDTFPYETWVRRCSDTTTETLENGPVHLLTAAGHFPLLKLLLKRDISTLTEKALQRALAIAKSRHCLETIQQLLDADAGVSSLMLYEAARDSDWEMLALLLSAWKFNYLCDLDLIRSTHRIMQKAGRFDLLQVLTEKSGAIVQWFLRHTCSSKGHVSRDGMSNAEVLDAIFNQLVGRMAEGDATSCIRTAARSGWGQELIAVALERQQHGLAEALVLEGVNPSEQSFLTALNSGDHHGMSVILNSSVSRQYIDHQDLDGASPLHQAVCENKKEMVNLLLKHGADVNCRHLLDGSTALDMCNSQDIRTSLLQHNAKSSDELKVDRRRKRSTRDLCTSFLPSPSASDSDEEGRARKRIKK